MNAKRKAAPVGRRSVAIVGDCVILTRARYEALIDRIEDLEDARVIRAREAHRARRDYLPAALAKRLLAGEHPVRVWRVHRGLTLSALAEKAGLPHGYLSEIEHGKKPGSLAAMKALAAALGLSVDDLIR